MRPGFPITNEPVGSGCQAAIAISLGPAALPAANRCQPNLHEFRPTGPRAGGSADAALSRAARRPSRPLPTPRSAWHWRLQAQGPRRGSLCLMPAWSFAASAHAAVSAGLRPHFLDVGAGLRHPDAGPCPAGAGTHAAGQGSAPSCRSRRSAIRSDVAAWDRFYEQTRIPVVIDRAAGFDAMRPGRVPSVVSLHATKIMPAAEGGFVIARDKGC